MAPEPKAAHELKTERLQLRRWVPSDRDPFAALNSDPWVMQHFPGVLSREESDALADRIESSFALQGDIATRGGRIVHRARQSSIAQSDGEDWYVALSR